MHHKKSLRTRYKNCSRTNSSPIRNKPIAIVTSPRERHSSPSDRNRSVISSRVWNDGDLFGIFLEKGEFVLDMDIVLACERYDQCLCAHCSC